jgi:hypothetical protein
MRPIGIRHIICVNRTGKIIGRALGDDLILSVQNPIRLSNDGMPQPDLAVFADRGADAPMPTDGEVLLVIEVSDAITIGRQNCHSMLSLGSPKPGSSIS